MPISAEKMKLHPAALAPKEWRRFVPPSPNDPDGAAKRARPFTLRIVRPSAKPHPSPGQR